MLAFLRLRRLAATLFQRFLLFMGIQSQRKWTTDRAGFFNQPGAGWGASESNCKLAHIGSTTSPLMRRGWELRQLAGQGI